MRVEGWEWLAGWQLDGLQPNSGHEAVAALARQGRLLACVTQNTDGLHRQSGLPLDKVCFHVPTRRAPSRKRAGPPSAVETVEYTMQCEQHGLCGHAQVIEVHGSRKHVNCLRRSQDRWLNFSEAPPTAAAAAAPRHV